MRTATSAAADAIDASAHAAAEANQAVKMADEAEAQAKTAKTHADVAQAEADKAVVASAKAAGFAHVTAQAAVDAGNAAAQVAAPANDAIQLGSPYVTKDSAAGLVVLTGQASKTIAEQQKAVADAHAKNAAPGFWRSPVRGARVHGGARAGSARRAHPAVCDGPAVVRRVQPDLAPVNDKTPGKGLLGFYLFAWPTGPHWLYRLTQGLHVTVGFILVPVLLAKLWSVIPKLFVLPPVRSAWTDGRARDGRRAGPVQRRVIGRHARRNGRGRTGVASEVLKR